MKNANFTYWNLKMCFKSALLRSVDRLVWHPSDGQNRGAGGSTPLTKFISWSRRCSQNLFVIACGPPGALWLWPPKGPTGTSRSLIRTPASDWIKDWLHPIHAAPSLEDGGACSAWSMGPRNQRRVQQPRGAMVVGKSLGWFQCRRIPSVVIAVQIKNVPCPRHIQS